MQIPVQELSSDTDNARLSEEVWIVPWPIDLEGLSREIDAAGRGDQGGGAIFESPPRESERSSGPSYPPQAFPWCSERSGVHSRALSTALKPADRTDSALTSREAL